MKPKIILLIEDNPDDVELIKRALHNYNVSNVVVVARDGAEALNYFFGEGGAQRPLPDLMILDLRLPKVDGLEVLAQLRAEQRTALLPIVVLTSSQEQRDLMESYRGGANSFVRKPVEFEDFLKAVHSLGMYWVVLNEVAISESDHK
jgi:CheY-like chemotaxis protein